VNVADAWGPFTPDLHPNEREARRRELRAVALAFCGPLHPLTQALRARTPEALAAALAAIDRMPPLPRRKLLSTYAVLYEEPEP
jgi:hypothetical protein